MAATRPSCREDFEIAIICALPLEYNAVSLVLDEFWDEEGDQFGRAAGDFNNYTTGRIGKHNVVLVLLPQMGKANAAGAAASIRPSYGGIRLALIVGICGGVPRDSHDNEILLGDVVVSKTIIQHDFGRQYPDGFVRKDSVEDSLSKPNKNIRNLLVIFETDRGLDNLQKRTAYYLKELQASAIQKRSQKYIYPGVEEDKLFESSYRHKHYVSPKCICSSCNSDADPVCEEALRSSCGDLGCDDTKVIPRDQVEMKWLLEQDKSDEAQDPAVHVGSMASGDTVMKSGAHRDRVAKAEGVIAFEMEGAGVWEEVPCIVVKAVCDYADCHKNKKWQNFAAATAASAAKAILERYIQTDRAVSGDGK
jgi:nucleoside phosphorylase